MLHVITTSQHHLRKQLCYRAQNFGLSPDQQLKKVSSSFNGFPIPSQTLSQNFSMDYLIATLSRLTSLKTLSLVSLGIWGQVLDKIQRLYIRKYIDMSYNYLYGPIPLTFTRLASLESVNLDGNFFNSSFPDGIDLLSNLTSLSLKENGFTGQLPDLPNFPNRNDHFALEEKDKIP
ncbi:putative histone deacetylase [Helianthus annuus]|nr:putative histone deacetylase [Helianthus annuus]